MMRPDWSKLRWLMPYFGRQRGIWAAAALATIVTSATEPVLPALMKPFLDRGLQPGGFPLWLVPAALLLLFTVRGIASFLSDLALAKITQDGLVLLRRDMFDRLLDAHLSLFRQQNATALSNTLVFEVQNGATLLVNAVTGLLKDSVSLIGLLAYLLYLNWQLTLIVFLIAPAVAWLIRTVSRRLYNIARRTQTATNDLAYVVEENVLAARMVRLHGAQADQARRFFGLSTALRQLAMKTTVAQATVTPLTHLMAAAALSVVICIALWQSRTGLTVGGFAAFITAMLMLIAPMKRLSEAASPISRGLAALQRAIELIEQTPAESGGRYQAERAQGRILMQSVSVRYQDDARPALDGITLSVEPGEIVALVGPSGSGKTTLANLLPRFVQPTSGRVLLDGVDVSGWDLRSLRRHLGAHLPPTAQSQALRCLDDVTTGAERIASNVRALQGLATRSATQPIDLAAVVSASLRLAAPSLGSRAHVIRQIFPVRPVIGEESRIGQAVLAMIMFSSSGFDTEAANAANRIVVAVEERGRDVVVEVTDNGRDLPPEEARRAFDPFFRSQTRGAGVGVGLGIARSVAATLGGEVTLTPRPGGGAVITMRLPAVAE